VLKEGDYSGEKECWRTTLRKLRQLAFEQQALVERAEPDVLSQAPSFRPVARLASLRSARLTLVKDQKAATRNASACVWRVSQWKLTLVVVLQHVEQRVPGEQVEREVCRDHELRPKVARLQHAAHYRSAGLSCYDVVHERVH